MPFQPKLSEIEETIDILSELRNRLEENDPESLVVMELTRLELKLHEQARNLRRNRSEPAEPIKKGPKSTRKSTGKPAEAPGRTIGAAPSRDSSQDEE